MATVTKTFLPTGYDTTRSAYYSITNPNNFVNCDTISTTRTNIYLVRGSQAETFFYVNFDFSEIPENATITSISGKIKGRCTGNGNYISYRQFRPYVGDTVRGYSKNFTVSDQVLDIDFGTGSYTREQLDDLTIRLYAKRTSSGTNNSYYFYLYGAEITITYEYNDGTPVYLKENGQWVQVDNVYVKENGTWELQSDFTNLFDNNKIYVKR